MANKRGYRLDKGFLMDYNWSPALERLTDRQFRRLVCALQEHQRSGGCVPLPDFSDDPILETIAQLILPQIQNRLRGAAQHDGVADVPRVTVRPKKAEDGVLAEREGACEAPATPDDLSESGETVSEKPKNQSPDAARAAGGDTVMPTAAETAPKRAKKGRTPTPAPEREQNEENNEKTAPFWGIIKKETPREPLWGGYREALRQDFDEYWGEMGEPPHLAPPRGRRRP